MTPTFVISTALATRDFQDVHHDRDRAVARGSQDIFLNILTTTGLVQRYVTDWAGPRALVRAVAIRLGVPCYAGDTLTFSGQVTDGGPAAGRDRGAGGRAVRPRRPRHRHRARWPGPGRRRSAARDRRRGGHRRDRGHRVLQELRAQRAAAGRRGRAGRPGRRRAQPARGRRPGHLLHGQHGRDRAGPRAGPGRAAVLQPRRLRRRRRLRHRAAGRAGRRRRRGPGRGLLPGPQRAVRPPVRPGVGRRRGRRDLVGHRQRLDLPHGPVHPGRHRGHDRPALHARLRRDQRGLRPGHRGRPPPRRHQPAGLVLPAAGDAGRAPGLPVDRRAAAAAGLLPGERRRRRGGGHQPGPGPRPGPAARP